MTHENKNEKPRLRFLSNQLIERIIDEAMEVLEKVGVFIKSEEGLELLGEAGARINRGKQQAFISRRLVEDTLKTVPPSVKLYDRNGNLHASLEGDNVYFVPSTTSIHVWDSQTRQHREASTQDHIHYATLIDSLEHFSLQSTAFYPADVPKEISSYLRTYICMKYGTKPGWGSVMARRENVDTAIELLKVLRGSTHALQEKPLFYLSAVPTSPLRWDPDNYYMLARAAENGVPAVVISGASMGATSPITIAGTLVQTVAEVFSGMVTAQLINPGTPLLFSALVLPLDMRTGSSPYGTVETAMGSIAAAEVFKYMNLPVTAHIAISGAKSLDSQCGLETGTSVFLGALNRVNVISGGGGLGSGSSFSLDKLVIDNEICGIVKRLLEGIIPRSEKLAEDLFTAGMFDGDHFMLSQHTLKWFKEEVYYPGPIISRESLAGWQDTGGTSVEQRAREEVKRILSAHQAEPLDPDVDKELMRIITRQAQKYGMSKLPLP